MVKHSQNPADYIVPLEINGLHGRLLQMSATIKAKREILFIYGHHSTLERWWGLVEVFSEYGSVSMPDLPGFGGMDSFYKINQKPTIDVMADYLAAFIKWRYKRTQKFTVIGMSFGFVVITRMLQRYPELSSKIDVLISIVGFAHHEDFVFSKPRKRAYRLAVGFLSRRIPAFLFRYIGLNPIILRTFYARTFNAKKKFKAVSSKEDFDQLMDMEIVLWHQNDVRTHMYTTHEFLALDNCTSQIDLPVWHVSTKNDHFFNHAIVEQHMRIIFSEFYDAEMNAMSHAPSVIADAAAAAPFIPQKLRDYLRRTQHP